jgi:hypothetical protein
MAYGDVNYEVAKTASVAYVTTGLSQALLLTDNSLSANFNLDEVFILQIVQTGANAMRVAPSSLSNDISVWPFSAASANASANFVFLRREP